MLARSLIGILSLSALLFACGSTVSSPPAPPPCDEKCKDGIAIKALRETTKLTFNLTLQGKPVGAHDVTTPCPLGGTARVFGQATSNAVQGSTQVELTYVLDACRYSFADDDADDNYTLIFTGTVTQRGVIAVQPSATSALVMKSESVALSGTVHDPPLEYVATCPVELGQNGNALSGTICGREANADL